MARDWHALEIDVVLEELSTDGTQGLTASDAARRLIEYGRNELGGTEGPSRWRILVGQFTDMLIFVLLVAAIISGVLLDEWIDASVILAIVILNAVIGYTQETRAEDALARLKEMSAPVALVVRDGVEVEISTEEVVPGDLIVLEAGDRVSADARVLSDFHLQVEEAALTGESLPVSKRSDALPSDAALGDMKSMVFGGTVVSAGRGQAVVVATGATSEMGKIAGMLEHEDRPSPLQIELDRIGKRIAWLTLGIAVVIFLLGFLRDPSTETLQSSFLIAVALAVAAIPEGLPGIVTITLARGVQAMARSNAIVRKLSAVEALGAAGVICTDKTGTLTRNEMRVQELDFADLHAYPADATSSDRRVWRYAQVAALCNDARKGPDGFIGDPTEIALLKSVTPTIVKADELRAAMPRHDEIAFDSGRKMMTTVHATEDGFLIAVKGAPEVVLDRCHTFESQTGTETMNSDRARSASQVADEMAQRGLRTLGFAYRQVAELPPNRHDIESDLTFVGIVGMSDELRPETRPSIEQAEAAGVVVVMVTGDHLVTAEAIANDLGLLGERTVISGTQLREMDQNELDEIVESVAVYARVDPADKVKIVKAWKARGAVAAMTGDGVNDAPALQAADIGVAMGSGTDVAKEAADIVLADDNFASIIKAVSEGRTIFSNLKKVVYFLMSSNASEVLLMFFGFLLFGGLGEPLLATQLLWINLVTDGLPALALGIDPPPSWLMSQSPSERRNILGAQHQIRILWQGAVLAMGGLAAIVWGHYVIGAEWEYVRTLTFTTMVLLQLSHVYNVRAQGTSVWKVGFGGNRLLGWGITVSLALQLILLYTPIGNRLFETVPLEWSAWPAMAAFTIVPFLSIDAIKRLISGRHPEWASATD